MYGYFRPNSSRLTSTEHRVFNAHYCRICYCLRLLAGTSARFLTTYDVAIYSIILKMAVGGETPPNLLCQRFRKGNMRKFTDDETGLKLARLSIVAVGEKVRDDLLDGSSFKAKALYKMFKKPIAEAQKTEPKFAELARAATDKINVLQDSGAPFDEILDCYGQMLQDIFAEFGVTDERFALLYRNLAKWTFFIDMLCDYDEDFKDGAYNFFKREDCPTLADYFDRYWLELYEKNKLMSGALLSSLYAVQDDSPEWRAVYKLIAHALDSVVPRLLSGEDVQYHYLKSEAAILWEIITRKKKSNFR